MATVIHSTDKGLLPTEIIGSQNRVLSADSHVDIIHAAWDLNEGVPMHYHKKDKEMMYILTGKFEVVISSKNDVNKIDKIIANSGDFVICPPYTWRAFTSLKDKSSMLIINSPGGASAFLKDLWKSQSTETGVLTKKYHKIFEQRHGIVISSPKKSKL